MCDISDIRRMSRIKIGIVPGLVLYFLWKRRTLEKKEVENKA